MVSTNLKLSTLSDIKMKGKPMSNQEIKKLLIKRLRFNKTIFYLCSIFLFIEILSVFTNPSVINSIGTFFWLFNVIDTRKNGMQLEKRINEF